MEIKIIHVNKDERNIMNNRVYVTLKGGPHVTRHEEKGVMTVVFSTASE